MKGLFLSFRKIKKLLQLDLRKSSYGSWKSVQTIDLTAVEGDVAEDLSAATTFVLMIQFQKCYDFLKAYKETFQMVCFNPKFRWGPNLSFFGLGPWAIYYSWYDQYFYRSNINFDDTIWNVFFKLSENKNHWNGIYEIQVMAAEWVSKPLLVVV